MPRRSIAAGMAAGLAAAVILMLTIAPSGAAREDEPQEVVVTNFPDTQDVRGQVRVEGPVHQASFLALEEVEVPPVSRADVTRLIDAGVLETKGFGAVVLSLVGTVKGRMKEPGDVGVILVPDVEAVTSLVEERGLIRFPLEVKAPAVLASPWFHSDQPRYTVGFPRYRALIYNGTDTTVTLDLYAYLTN